MPRVLAQFCNTITYSVVLLALGLQAEELLFLLPVVEGTDGGHDENSHENCEALNPRY